MANPDEPLALALRFMAALGLGVLLGLEREHSHPDTLFAGVRTFGLISLAGGMAAYVGGPLGQPALAVALFAAIAALVVVSTALGTRQGDLGITTEVSALLAFVLGFLCVSERVTLAAGLAVASAGVLALKQWLHDLAHRIESADVSAALKFAIVTLIILPLVPDQTYGPPPFDVINPYKLWWMVVLISGLNLASYILVKVLGTEHGVELTGLLGGLVSSTAVSLGLAQRSRAQPEQAPALALGILLAWSVMFFRVVLLVAVVSPALGRQLALGMGALGVLSIAIVLVMRGRQQTGHRASVSAGANPFDLGEAIRFGLLFGVVTLLARVAQIAFGDPGLYLAGVLSGLVDVDAVALSMAQLVRTAPESVTVAARAIVIAVLVNTLVKGGMAVFIGGPELRGRMLPITGVLLAAGAVIAWLS